MLNPTFLAILFASAGLGMGLAPFRRATIFGLCIAIAPTILAVACIANDMANTKGAHNLFPLEIAGVATATVIPALLALAVGLALRPMATPHPVVYIAVLSIAGTMVVFSTIHAFRS